MSLLVASILLIVVSQLLQLEQVTGMMLSCAPLLIYHWGVLARRSRGTLSQQEVDSVYYFGFLITIASLAAGVYFFQQAGSEPTSEDVKSLMRQFAVGIAATAYAVFARMHLASRSAGSDVRDPQELLNAQVLQVQDILQHMSAVSVAAMALTQSLDSARDQVLKQSAKQMADALNEVTRQFSAHLSESLMSLNAISQQVRTTLGTVNELTVEQAIPRALRELSSASKALSENTLAAASASLEAATAISMVGQEFRGMQGAIASGRAGMAALEDVATSLKAFDAATASSAEAVTGNAAEIIRITGELRDVGDAVSTAPRTMKRLADQVERTAEGMDFLAGVAAKLDDAANGLGRAAGSADSLLAGLDGIARVAPGVASGLEEVRAGTEDTTKVMGALTKSMQSAGTAVSRLEIAAGSLEQGNAGLAQLARESAVLASGLSKLTAQIAESQRELTGATGQVTAAAATSAAALKRDLESATESASLVSQRLVTLVNTIIEQTNRQQGARR